MLAVKHFFAYLPASQPDPLAMERIRQGFEVLGYRVAGQSYLRGFIPIQADAVESNQPQLLVRLTAGTAANASLKFADVKALEAATKYAADKLRLFTLLSCNDDSLDVVSDTLTLLPYYIATIDGGTVICSSVRHLFAACPQLSRQMDDQGVYEFMCCGTPLGSRTLHKQVRLASAGQAIHWDRAQGLQIDRSGRANIAPANPCVAASFAADQIATYVRESLSRLPVPGIITLTGGFDSRLITCFAIEAKLDVRMVTIGYPRFEEVQVALALARSLGASTTVFPPPHPDVLDFLPVWLECLEGLADSPALFLSNLLSFPEPDGTPIYHGFINDTLSGALLDRICGETAVTPEDISKGIASHWLGGVLPQAGELLRLSGSMEGALLDIQAELIAGIAPHQAATYWNLENIQRRLVAQQLLYVGQRLMPAPVFYYRPLMEYWLSLPRMALDNKALLGYLYQRRWPRVATLPHAEHVPSQLPRTRPAMQYLARWILRHYGWQAARRLGLNVDKLEARTDAWAMWHGSTEQQKKKEMAALEETLDLLKSHLGWDAPRPGDTLWSSCNSIQRKQLFMLRRMYLLGEYARSLPQTAASTTVPPDIQETLQDAERTSHHARVNIES